MPIIPSGRDVFPFIDELTQLVKLYPRAMIHQYSPEIFMHVYCPVEGYGNSAAILFDTYLKEEVLKVCAIEELASGFQVYGFIENLKYFPEGSLKEVATCSGCYKLMLSLERDSDFSPRILENRYHLQVLGSSKSGNKWA